MRGDMRLNACFFFFMFCCVSARSGYSIPVSALSFSFLSLMKEKKQKKIKANAMLAPLCRAHASPSVTAFFFIFCLVA
jgi:hypothetical protein